MPAHLLGFIVDTTGCFTDVANAAHAYFSNVEQPALPRQPYWCRDWSYPLWRAHGHAKVFVDYMALLQQHAPTDAGGRLYTLDYGQYLHFKSGAAG